MKRRLFLFLFIAALLLVLAMIAAACRDDGEAETETPTPAPAAGEFTVTFDGENCRYEGPEVVSEGDVGFVFNNLSDQPKAHLHVVALTEGITWQDILELHREPIPFIKPREVIELPVSFPAGEFDVQEYALKPGSHGVLCVIHGVDGWPAAPLEVTP